MHTHFFLLFARRIKGGASRAGSGLEPQWNLPELAATPGSAGCWSENAASSQMCQGSKYTGGPGLASLLAHQSSLRTGRKRLKWGGRGFLTHLRLSPCFSPPPAGNDSSQMTLGLAGFGILPRESCKADPVLKESHCFGELSSQGCGSIGGVFWV